MTERLSVADVCAVLEKLPGEHPLVLRLTNTVVTILTANVLFVFDAAPSTIFVTCGRPLRRAALASSSSS